MTADLENFWYFCGWNFYFQIVNNKKGNIYMLQFATDSSSLMPQKQQVETALNEGCQWIRLTSETDVEAIMEICKEKGVMLVLDDDVETVDRLRIHGLHMTQWDRGSVIATREKLGPHAVLGLTFPIDGDPEQLKALDVDYITVPKPDSEDYLAEYGLLIDKMLKLKLEIHPVASGNFAYEELEPLIATGMEGVEVSGKILDIPVAGIIPTMLHILTNANRRR